MPMMMPMLFPGMANPMMGGAAASEQMQELMKKQLELMSQMQQTGQVCDGWSGVGLGCLHVHVWYILR